MTQINMLKPGAVWSFFEEILAIPRPSKKEDKIIQYIISFAEKNKLEYIKDEQGNILIRKPASKGYENRKSVCLQSHLDMVCEKNSGSTHNFETDPIQTLIDGDWVKASGTTL